MQDVIEAWVARLREDFPDAVAVLLKGSHARGEAHAWSDIDFDVLVDTPDTEAYRAWIEPVEGRLVHTSVAVEALQSWLDDTDEPSEWSLGLPTHERTKLLWAATDALWQELDRPSRTHPAMDPEIEDTMEALGKMRSALARGDDIGVYRNAAKFATLLPTLLAPLNPPVSVSNSRAAIDAVLAFPHVPAGFGPDWLLCMGYVDARTPAQALAAATRLFHGVLAMLPADAPYLDDDFAGMLADGTLLAYLNQGDTR